MKNRDRVAPTFANINLLGKCNVDCFFCLGKDLEAEIKGINQLATHFSDWRNFEDFLEICKKNEIAKLYVTGQNTDSLLYKYLSELVQYLQVTHGFPVGLRTNGYLAMRQIDVINKCRNSTGYSIHTLNGDTNSRIMGRDDLPIWDEIIPETERPRISIVVNRFNKDEFMSILEYLSQFRNIRYVQARRVSTDMRYDMLYPDMQAYDDIVELSKSAPLVGHLYSAEIRKIHGLDVVLWPTVATTANSFNYFTDGTISEAYFIVEGYLLENCLDI